MRRASGTGRTTDAPYSAVVYANEGHRVQYANRQIRLKAELRFNRSASLTARESVGAELAVEAERVSTSAWPSRAAPNAEEHQSRSVPKRTYTGIPACQDRAVRGDAMPKAEVVGSAPRRRARRRTAELPNTVEGQIAEICRDLAVQAKRMRQLHEQADELRRVIRQWVGQSEADLYANQLIVKDDAEK